MSVSLLTVASIAAIYTLISGAGPQPAVRVPTVAPAAMVDGVTISAAEMDAAIAPTLAKLQEQIYSARLTRLNTIIDDRLVGDAAKKRKVSPEAFLASELAGKAAPVSDAEIAAFFESNKAKLPGDLPKWQDQIRKYLSEQRQVDARASLIARLREDAHVKVMLDPPPVYRATVDLAGAPVRGAAAAPVTVVEFSDFHCPFCRQVQPVLRQLLQEYGDRLRIVYKDMPIDGLHPQARGVAEAARCAADQGRFWEFHDKVYAGGPDGSAATMQRYASEAGVELSQFESCRASRKHQAGVQRDVQEGADLGLTGTPGFFINGRFLSGSQPLEAFTRVIDQELAAGGTAGAR
ncbi:MAG: thioredoxin domain-containing protein [Vicinamibacterales bacterium]